MSRAQESLDSGSIRLHIHSADTFSKAINMCFPNKTQSIQNIRTKVWSYTIIILIITLTLEIHGSNTAFIFIYLQNESTVQRSVRASNLSRPPINALMSLLAFTDLDLKLCLDLSIPTVCGKHLTVLSLLSPILLECALSLLGMFYITNEVL